MKKHYLYYLLTLLVVVAGGTFTYFKVQHYMALQGAIAQNQTLLQKLNGESAGIEKNLTEITEKFKTEEERFHRQLLAVLPEGEQYTQLARDLDIFFEENFTEASTFVASSLRFGQGTQSGDYAILPVSLTIESSEKNFFKFMEFVENSGALAENTRIMDIQSVRIALPGEEASTGNYNYTVNLNAYSRHVTE